MGGWEGNWGYANRWGGIQAGEKEETNILFGTVLEIANGSTMREGLGPKAVQQRGKAWVTLIGASKNLEENFVVGESSSRDH